QVHTVSFIARNETDGPETFTIYAGDWDRDEEGGTRFYPPGALPRSLAPWLSVAPGSFTLGPGETREIGGTLKVPTGTGIATGTYWGIVFVHGEPRPVQHQGTTVMVAKRIGIKVYATVGTAPMAGEVRGLESRGLNPLWLRLQFVNTATVNLREVKVEVEVYDRVGSQVTKVTVDPFPLLPGAARWVVVTTDFRPAPGDYHVLAKVDIGGDALLAGQVSLRVRSLALVPVAGAKAAPRDPDGDGFYEDTNGDGVFDEADVITFLAVFGHPVIQGNWWAFDFNNDGVVDWADVFEIERMLGR
ncbi:MAG: hypothetical protein ABID40_01835, partial [Candidatus Bipolaricaulota bacterium]